MHTMTLPKKDASSSKVYYKFARYYDHLFTPIYKDRICSTIQSLNIPPDAKVLEVGVGTGISLDAYPPSADVLAVDLSQAMLDQAAARVESLGLTNVRLQMMDALNIEAEDETFDFVMAFHIVSVVNDVDRMMQGLYRVCKPGGKIIVINHFRSPKFWLAPLVDLASPLTRKLGWRTNLKIDEVVNAVPIQVDRQYKTTPYSLFRIIVASKPIAV